MKKILLGCIFIAAISFPSFGQCLLDRIVTPSSSTICAGDYVDLTIESSQLGVTYELYVNGNPTGTTTVGNGNNVYLASPYLETTSTLRVWASGGECTQPDFLTQEVVITVNPLPTANLTLLGPTEICPQESISLQFDLGPGTYNVTYFNGWENINLYEITDGHIENESPEVGELTYYIVSVIDNASGCQSIDPSPNITGSPEVLVHPSPFGTLFGEVAICEGVQTYLDVYVPSEGEYNIEIFDGTSSFFVNNLTGESQIPVSPVGTTTYSLINVTDANTGCTSPGQGNAYIDVIPKPTPNIFGPAAVCLNESAQFYTDEAQYEYNWSGTDVSINDPESVNTEITFSTPGLQTIQVTYLTENECLSNTGILEVMVQVPPTPVINGNFNVVCQDETETYSTDPGQSIYFWSIDPQGAGTIISDDNNGTVEVQWSSLGSLLVSYITPDGCMSTEASESITTLSIPGWVEANPFTSCGNGEPLNFNLDDFLIGSSDPYTFEWYVDSDNSEIEGESITLQTGSIITDALLNTSSTTQLLTYTVTATNGDGCVGPPTPLTISLTAAATVSAGDDATFCPEIPYQLSGTSIGGGATTAAWSILSGPNGHDGVLSDYGQTETPDQVTFTASVPGTYVLVLTTDDPDGVGPCSAVNAQITLTTESGPNAGLDGNATVCNNTSINLDEYLNVADPGGDWEEITSSGAPGESGLYNFDGVPPGVYQFRYTALNCAGEDDATISVTVLSVPGLNVINNSPSIPSGGTTDIVLSDPNNTPGTTFSWTTDDPAGLSGYFSDSGSEITQTLVAHLSTGSRSIQYTITAEAAGCTGASQITQVTVGPNLADSLALVAIYEQAGGAGWTNNTNWLSANPMSTWHGVLVVKGMLVSVDLSNNNLTGNIPSSIGDLRVGILNLSGNQLTGSIPASIGDNLILTSLDLSDNNLSGTIEFSFANLSMLETIDLSNNSLSGAIPADIGSISSLQSVNLSNNQFSGTIPEEIGNLPQLSYLNLGSNQLSGSIPASLGLTPTSSIILSNNQLSGTIPDGLSHAGLTELRLNINQLTGAVPNDFATNESLVSLSLEDNFLTDLPDLTGMTSINEINVSQNYFTFEDLEPNVSLNNIVYAPQRKITAGETITVGYNTPIDLGVWVGGSSNEYEWQKNGAAVPGANTSQLYIESATLTDAGTYVLYVSNDFVPNLTLSTENFEVFVNDPPINPADSMALVALYDETNGDNWTNRTNWKDGPVESWYGVEVIEGRVTSLSLASNNLVGAVPSSIGNLTQLQYLTLSDNQLSSLPEEIGNLTLLQSLNLASNQITNLPSGLSSLTTLQSLLLSSNNLTSIPDLSNLTALSTLSVDNNALEFDDFEAIVTLPIASKTMAPQRQIGLPAIQSVNIGQPVTFSVSTGGTNNIYQWKRNGDDIPGATSTSLTITSVALADQGNYSVEVTNSVVTGMSIFSAPITLLVSESTNVTDSLALVSIYNTTNGNQWLDRTNWLTGLVRTWHGVTVVDGRVTSLALPDNQLEGSIPDQIGLLEELIQLDISGNSITSISAGIANLTNLVFINAANNQITTLPEEISDMTAIQNLTVTNNMLTSLPDLSNLVNLSTLGVIGNALDFADLEPVMELGITNLFYAPQRNFGIEETKEVTLNNPLTLTFTVGGSNNLYQWQKDEVNITGANNNTFTKPNALPSDEGVYRLLVTNSSVPSLTLLSNNITVVVDVPTNLADSTALVNLYNNTGGANWTNPTNWLSGDLDTWHGVTMHLGRVAGLNLSNNNLTGTLPTSLGNLEMLSTLDFSNNNLTGVIPSSVGSLTNLSALRLNSNQLSGNIPTSLGLLVNLAVLDLMTNNLQGGIPNELSSLTSLEVLRLGVNGLTGTIPVSFGNLTALEEIDLHQNNLTGLIPASFVNLENLSQVILRDNNFAALPNLTSLSLTLLSVENNLLGFEDLEPNITIQGFTFSPQKNMGLPEEHIKEVGEDLLIESNQGGTANHYTWKKNNIVITDETSSALNITNIQLGDDATYSFEVTNDIVPGLTLISNPIVLKVSSILRDSLALIQIYEQTGGTNWTNKNNWLTNDLSTWQGVGINNNRVTSLSLPNNNLTGPVPNSLREMLSLQSINLSSNNITSVPDLRNLTNLTTLNLSGNALQFGSLEANAGITGIQYQNQKLVPLDLPNVINVSAGDPQNLSIVVSGTSNIYQWKRNNNNAPGGSLSNYNIAALTRETQGTYRCEITNPLVPGLTLRTKDVRINGTVSLEGTLTANGNPAKSPSVVYLLGVTSSNGFDTLATQTVNEIGKFKFDNVILGDYQVAGFATNESRALPTYYPSTIFWEEADTLFVSASRNDLDIVSQLEPSQTPTGSGVIKGIVEEDDGTGSGRTLAKKGVANAGVSARRVENTSRGKEEVLILIAYVFTNENGEFELTNLPPAEYRLNIQYPGYPMDENSFVTIPVGTGRESVVEVAASVEPEGHIQVRKVIITGIWEESPYIADVFPNPTQDFINLEFEKESTQREITLYDISGRLIQQIDAKPKKVSLDVRPMGKGSYVLNVSENGMIRKSIHLVIE